MAKYNYIELSQKSKWTELELKAYFKFLNNSTDEKLKDAVSKSFNYNPRIYDAEGIDLTSDQVKKGAKYLYNLGFTPKGNERKNSPYGAREEYIVKNLKDIVLLGSYDAGGWTRSYYIPLYEAIGKDGTTMEYYVWGGKINIIG